MLQRLCNFQIFLEFFLPHRYEYRLEMWIALWGSNFDILLGKSSDFAMGKQIFTGISSN